jgi:hypothetical protein
MLSSGTKYYGYSGCRLPWLGDQCNRPA